MNIGENLRRIRMERDITQAEIAEILDVTQVFISKVESNIKRLSVEQVFELSQMLDCSTDDIIIGKEG